MIENNFKLPDNKRVQNITGQTVFKEPRVLGIRLPEETSLGLPENVAGSLTYLFGFISGFIMLLGERNNSFVRYHALQSIYISIAFFSTFFLLGLIPFFGWFSNIFMGPFGLILWVSLMLNAYKGNFAFNFSF